MNVLKIVPCIYIKSKPAIIVCILTVHCCTLYSIYVCTGLIAYVIVLNGRLHTSIDMTVVVECDIKPLFNSMHVHESS